MAGLGPGDIDVAELYDCFTIVPIIELEELGFCEAGRGRRILRRGARSHRRQAPRQHARRHAVACPCRRCRRPVRHRRGRAPAARRSRASGRSREPRSRWCTTKAAFCLRTAPSSLPTRWADAHRAYHVPPPNKDCHDDDPQAARPILRGLRSRRGIRDARAHHHPDRHRELRVPLGRLQRCPHQSRVLQDHPVRRADRARPAHLRDHGWLAVRERRQRRHAARAAADRRAGAC